MKTLISLPRYIHWLSVWVVSVVVVCCLVLVQSAGAINQLPVPDPKPGSFGIEATKNKAAPTQVPRITTPGNGGSFSTSPITVNGLCFQDLLVQIYNNNVMVGSVMCQNGSFSLEVSLFAGANELSAIQYDELGQASPASDTVTVNYTDTRFTAFGELVTLTSSYGRRSAAAGSQLTWPLQLSGGTGPYALSIDWGDGSEAQLQSQALAGVFSIIHTYKQAGIYRVNVRVTDSNGVSAFLQLVAVSSGQVDDSAAAQTTGNDTKKERVIILWVPAAVALLLLFPTYWLGRRSQLVSLRSKMLAERDAYQQDSSSK